jgi:hypothetical protein
MEIGDWQTNDADGVIPMEPKEAKFVPLKLMSDEATASKWKTQKATKKEIEALAFYILGKRVVYDQELFGEEATIVMVPYSERFGKPKVDEIKAS